MKRCPQCDNVYTDETKYCSNDGAVLAEESFSLPSEGNFEEDTIIRRDPIIIDYAQPTKAPEQIIYQDPAPNPPTIIVERHRGTGKYFLFLIIGLLLGGGLVLATLLLAGAFNRTDNAVNLYRNKNQTGEVGISNRISNSQNNVNASQNNAFTANEPHDEKTNAEDDEFNGRVITLNAYVRSAPSKSAVQISVLPKDDRINIGTRENSNSPWYQVACEHGANGWMHGDTIEFTK